MDKYGFNTLEVGNIVFVPDLKREMDRVGGYSKFYRRLFYLANQKGIKVSIKRTEGGMNVERVG